MSVFDSRFIIDGVAQDLTPAQVLSPCMDVPPVGDGASGQIVDETLDPVPGLMETDPDRVDEYLTSTLTTESVVDLPFAGPKGRYAVAKALIDAIWRPGSFRLDNLSLDLAWHWPAGKIGAMASFYDSTVQIADYVDSLGLRISSASFSEGGCGISAQAKIGSSREADILSEVEDPEMGEGSLHPTSLVDDPQSWIVYIPFEASDYRLGGSLLAQTSGYGGGKAPQIDDPDYFMDCYEVVRELVEDGIILSGATVGDGGLLTSLKRMTTMGVGADIDISSVVRAHPKSDVIRVLFSEVPGVLIQIKDIDFDYLDAELLLQDVAYYPLGHPVHGTDSVHVKASAKPGIQTILESLIRSQCGEGED